MLYDVAIIGAGVTGSLIARQLSQYDLKVCLIEREADVAMGTSKANSAIVHAGYDAKPGTLKAKLNVRGNELMEKISQELDVPFKRIGSFVIAFNEGDMSKLQELYQTGIINGVKDLQVITGEHAKEMEPSLSDTVIGALYAPSAGIICPYELTVGAVENAVANGVELRLEFEIEKIIQENGIFRLFSKSGEVQCRYLINAAGLHADAVSHMLEETGFKIKPRKGEYLLLDKNQGNLVNTIIFQTPSKMGKGILVTPTVDGNLLIGPNAHDIEDKEDKSTSSQGLNEVISLALKSVPSLNIREVITSFAGLRATPTTGDFIIETSDKVKGFINVAGIESPGLTAAPAIAEHVAGILSNTGLAMKKKESYSTVREPVKRFREMTEKEINEIIELDSRYGNIICRCERVTEGEIVNCIQRPAGARNLDAVKRRTRAGMGRCQGGFCSPRVIEILSRELGIPMQQVTKSGKNSKILVDKTK